VTEIWINEENLTDAFFKDLGHHMKINGGIESVYYIGDFAEGNYVEHNKNYLQEFLKKLGTYPLYLTFIYYMDEIEELLSQFDQYNISYTVASLGEKRTYYSMTGKHSYHPPCFSIQIPDAYALAFILEKTYWLAAQNEFYTISSAANLSFQLEEVKEWGRKRKRSVAVYTTDEKTTFITIFHDGNGFYLYSNQKQFASVEKLVEALPDGSVITQINDALIEKSDLEKQ
jgi:hypothetical protein